MGIAFLIVSCLSGLFAFSFLMSAVLIFATCDHKPLDPDTGKLMPPGLWFGGVTHTYLLVVARYWQHSQLGRRLFYTGERGLPFGPIQPPGK